MTTSPDQAYRPKEPVYSPLEVSLNQADRLVRYRTDALKQGTRTWGLTSFGSGAAATLVALDPTGSTYIAATLGALALGAGAKTLQKSRQRRALQKEYPQNPQEVMRSEFGREISDYTGDEPPFKVRTVDDEITIQKQQEVAAYRVLDANRRSALQKGRAASGGFIQAVSWTAAAGFVTAAELAYQHYVNDLLIEVLREPSEDTYRLLQTVLSSSEVLPFTQISKARNHNVQYITSILEGKGEIGEALRSEIRNAYPGQEGEEYLDRLETFAAAYKEHLSLPSKYLQIQDRVVKLGQSIDNVGERLLAAQPYMEKPTSARHRNIEDAGGIPADNDVRTKLIEEQKSLTSQRVELLNQMEEEDVMLSRIHGEAESAMRVALGLPEQYNFHVEEALRHDANADQVRTLYTRLMEAYYSSHTNPQAAMQGELEKKMNQTTPEFKRLEGQLEPQYGEVDLSGSFPFAGLIHAAILGTVILGAYTLGKMGHHIGALIKGGKHREDMYAKDHKREQKRLKSLEKKRAKMIKKLGLKDNMEDE